MTPVDQDRFYDPSKPVGEQRGNCLSAVIASLLNLPLAVVPNFVQIDVDGGENWYAHLLRFLNERGWLLIGGDYDGGPKPGEFYLCSGPSPRGNGIHHIVVYQDGALAHDPHPDRTGLLGVEVTWLLRRETDASAAA